MSSDNNTPVPAPVPTTVTGDDSANNNSDSDGSDSIVDSVGYDYNLLMSEDPATTAMFTFLGDGALNIASQSASLFETAVGTPAPVVLNGKQWNNWFEAITLVRGDSEKIWKDKFATLIGYCWAAIKMKVDEFSTEPLLEKIFLHIGSFMVSMVAYVSYVAAEKCDELLLLLPNLLESFDEHAHATCVMCRSGFRVLYELTGVRRWHERTEARRVDRYAILYAADNILRSCRKRHEQCFDNGDEEDIEIIRWDEEILLSFLTPFVDKTVRATSEKDTGTMLYKAEAQLSLYQTKLYHDVCEENWNNMLACMERWLDKFRADETDFDEGAIDGLKSRHSRAITESKEWVRKVAGIVL